MAVAIMVGPPLPLVKQMLGSWIFGIEKISGTILAIFGIIMTMG